MKASGYDHQVQQQVGRDYKDREADGLLEAPEEYRSQECQQCEGDNDPVTYERLWN